MAYPQADLIEFQSYSDRLLAQSQAKRANIDPPRIIILTAGPDLVFDARPGSTLGDKKVVSKLIIHNLGANPIKYAINQPASLLSYHDILAGGSSAGDGLGSLVDLSQEQVDFVSVIGTAGEYIAVSISYPLETAQ